MADSIRAVSRAETSGSKTPHTSQYAVVVKFEPPASAAGAAPTLRRQASSTGAAVFDLLSPLWRGGRSRALTPGRPRSASSRRQSAENPQHSARRLSGGGGSSPNLVAKGSPQSPRPLEYTLLLPTSWEADAWAAAIGESQRAVVQAASQQRWECVARLLRLGRDVHTCEDNGRNALHYSCGYGNEEALKLLLQSGGNINSVDAAGMTPIGFAANKNQQHLVSALLGAGADPSLAARCGVWQGKNAIDMARGVGADASVSLMLRHCWCQLLPFEIKLLVFAGLDAAALRAAELVCSEWQGLVYTGKQMGCLPELPQLPAHWHREAMQMRARTLPLRQRTGSGSKLASPRAGSGGAGAGSSSGGAGPSSPGSPGNGDVRHTLVLDLDETLVHASAVPMPRYDFSFTFTFQGCLHTMYVRKRPFLDAFFNHLLVSGAWEVVIFTASVRAYADALLDILDPAHELLTLRLYRDHCCPIEAAYTKELSVLPREMHQLVLVDNTPISFAYQPQNAIPIVTWRHEDADCELLKMIPLLDEMAAAHDVRPVLSRACRVKQITQAWHDAATKAAREAAFGSPQLARQASASAAPSSPRRRSPQTQADINATRQAAAAGRQGEEVDLD